MKPKSSAIKIVAACLIDSDSNWNENMEKMIIVNDGGTNSVEINLASLCEENKFNTL
jgi:hypothetical protein